jgi:hypothetical protein
MGFPIARLLAAVPAEILHVSLLHGCGSAGGAPPPPPPRMQQKGCGRGATASAVTLAPGEGLPETALVYALMQTERLVPAVTLARRRLETARHFGEEGARFERLVNRFTALLGSGTLSCGSGWLPRARAWHLVLLMHQPQQPLGGGRCRTAN